MKVRTGFVSNSSSSSFVIKVDNPGRALGIINDAVAIALLRFATEPKEYEKIRDDKYVDSRYGYIGVDTLSDHGWSVAQIGYTHVIGCETSMDNFDLIAFVKEEFPKFGIEFEIIDEESSG